MDLTSVNQVQIRTNIRQPTLGSDISASAEAITLPNIDEVPYAEVLLSPEAVELSIDKNVKPRFSSAEEFSEHSTKFMAKLTTKEEYESGVRRPFESQEDERLSKLSIKELIEEGNKLPRVDKNGHLSSSMHGTEQGDRINLAIGNILFKNQYERSNAAVKVQASVDDFKNAIKSEYKIEPNSYDVIFKDGKATVIGKLTSGHKAATTDELARVQKSLDGINSSTSAKQLQTDIKEFNRLSFEYVDNYLTPHIYGPEKNPFLTKSVSSDWLLDGTNYSSAESNSNLNEKYLSIIADARGKYNAAVKDGTLLSYYDIDKGLLELTKLRENINTKA
jgi:hypothetical protein